MICNLLPSKSSDSLVQQDLRQELLDFASKWPALKQILPEHGAELDEAGDHFFDFIIDKLFTGLCFDLLSDCMIQPETIIT